VAAEEPRCPDLRVCENSVLERVDEDTKEGFAELIEQLGEQVEEIELLPSAIDAWELHRTIMEAEMRRTLSECGTRDATVSRSSCVPTGARRNVRAIDYQRALSRIAPIHESFVELFEQRYDAILTPAATGAAPKGFPRQGIRYSAPCGRSAVCRISLPLLHSASGLPIGVQLSARATAMRVFCAQPAGSLPSRGS